jgi:hypothetical protein
VDIREEVAVAGGWSSLHNEEVHNFMLHCMLLG